MSLRLLHPETGFTIVELLISMALMGIALAAVAPLLVNTSSTGRQAHVDSRSLADVAAAANFLQSDLSKMQAVDRGDGNAEMWEQSIINDLRQTTAVNHDIYFASPTALIFFANVIETNAAGSDLPEAVSVYLEQASQPLPPVAPGVSGTRSRNCSNTWCLIREVRYGATVNAAGNVSWQGATVEILGHGKATFPTDSTCSGGGTAVRIFCYDASAPVNGDPSTCATAPATSVNGNSAGVRYDQTPVIRTRHSDPFWVREDTFIYELDRISRVRFLPVAGVEFGGDGRARRLTQSMTIRSHATPEYRLATNCGAK